TKNSTKDEGAYVGYSGGFEIGGMPDERRICSKQ
nr:hypothetical protein [Tanacetum cinerariifolium]